MYKPGIQSEAGNRIKKAHDARLTTHGRLHDSKTARPHDNYCLYIYSINFAHMSRGFVKEDDQEEIPMVPQRAYLPEGVPNFVTPSGMDLLLSEKQALISEKDNPGGANENENRIALNYINAKLQLLNNRISDARVINLKEQPQNEIRFGASVTLRKEGFGDIQTYQIVGVDEADISKGKISFISPVAKSMINKKTGDKVVLKRAKDDIVYEILDIAYR
jgi:transcription elongation factor GreB